MHLASAGFAVRGNLPPSVRQCYQLKHKPPLAVIAKPVRTPAVAIRSFRPNPRPSSHVLIRRNTAQFLSTPRPAAAITFPWGKVASAVPRKADDG